MGKGVGVSAYLSNKLLELYELDFLSLSNNASNAAK